MVTNYSESILLCLLSCATDFVPVPDRDRFPRQNLHHLSEKENTLNEWAWKATVKDVNEEKAKLGLLYGKTVCLKVRLANIVMKALDYYFMTHY